MLRNKLSPNPSQKAVGQIVFQGLLLCKGRKAVNGHGDVHGNGHVENSVEPKSMSKGSCENCISGFVVVQRQKSCKSELKMGKSRCKVQASMTTKKASWSLNVQICMPIVYV